MHSYIYQMRTFHDLDIAEHNGHGVPTIIKSYGKEVFDIHNDYINVIIPFNKDVIVNQNGNLNGNEEKIVKLILANERKTLDEYSQDIAMTKRTISRIFESLQEKGIVERVVLIRDGFWKVIK